jgi:hypothetical protein
MIPIGNRTRDVPACSAVPGPTALLLTLIMSVSCVQWRQSSQAPRSVTTPLIGSDNICHNRNDDLRINFVTSQQQFELNCLRAIKINCWHAKAKYKVVQIWPGLFVCKQVTVCPGHIWTTFYVAVQRPDSNVKTVHVQAMKRRYSSTHS